MYNQTTHNVSVQDSSCRWVSAGLLRVSAGVLPTLQGAAQRSLEPSSATSACPFSAGFPAAASVCCRLGHCTQARGGPWAAGWLPQGLAAAHSTCSLLSWKPVAMYRQTQYSTMPPRPTGAWLQTCRAGQRVGVGWLRHSSATWCCEQITSPPRTLPPGCRQVPCGALLPQSASPVLLRQGRWPRCPRTGGG